MKGAKAQLNLFDEIIVDNFAGGGGASTGIELATGRIVDIAINHDPDAILMHKTNHPHTKHYQESVWDIDPVEVCEGKPVGLAWFSPDCKHFSKAKGAKPVDKNIRGLAWVVLRWAGKVQPRVIILENVEEFKTWGPVRRGKPVKSKAGTTFRKWLAQLEGLGYTVDYRELVAADYGAPTIRKRFFLVARCDGKPVVWPEPTHSREGSGGKKKWRSAAEIIDWTLPCPSIFATREAIKEQYGIQAVRPLAANTLRRVARGTDKFVIKSAEPFIVQVNHSGGDRQQDIHGPMQTITAKHGYGICTAALTMHNNSNAAGTEAREPLNTITSSGAGGHQMLITPLMTAIGQAGGGERGRSIDQPVNATVSKAESCVVAPALIQYHTERAGEYVRGQPVDGPVMTTDAANRYGLSGAFLTKYYGTAQRGVPIDDPLHTVTAHDREGMTLAHLSKFYGGVDGSPARDPLSTVTAIDHNAVTTAHIVKMKGTNLGGRASEPLQTITAGGGHFGEIRTRLVKYDGAQELYHWPEVRELLNTYCGYSIAEDEILILEIGGIQWFISDIGLRMLTPRELYAANGFPQDYIISHDYKGNEYSKSKQVARCGNAVPPPFATALVRANLPEWCEFEITTMRQFFEVATASA